jgi:hypothetical protein
MTKIEITDEKLAKNGAELIAAPNTLADHKGKHVVACTQSVGADPKKGFLGHEGGTWIVEGDDEIALVKTVPTVTWFAASPRQLR